MARIEQRLAELSIQIPEPLQLPADMILPFPWVNVRGDRAYISGHGPQETDGSPSVPFGIVGDTVTLEQAQESARKTAFSMIGSLKRALGDLDRVRGWCRVHGMVNCVPGFPATPAVLNGFSDAILDVFGPDVGRHARTAIGVRALPLNFPVEIEAEVLIAVA